MPGYVITSVFEVSGGKLPLGADVLARAWGMGHRFSYCDGHMLTLVAELTAIDVGSAFEALLSRAEMVWQGLGNAPLGPPVTLRVQGAVEATPVPAGIPPADGEPPGAGRPRRTTLAREIRFFRSPQDEIRLIPLLDDEWPDDPPDDGGLAGVREPRRPRPGPPGLSAAQDLPDAGQPAAS
jgi:hypothetical protein